MADNYDDIIDGMAAQEAAGAGVAATEGVQPSHALIGIDGQPLTGMPAATGMHTPELTKTLSEGAVQRATIKSSPPVAQWAATADPAHVAATKDQFPALAKIASTVNDWNNQSIEDFFAPLDAAQKSASGAFKAYTDTLGVTTPPKSLLEGLVPGLTPQDQALGNFIKSQFGVLFSPLAGAANVLARPLSYIPRPVVDTSGLSYRVKGVMSQSEAQAAVANDFLTSTMGLAEGPLTEEGPVAASIYARRLEAPEVAAARPNAPPPGAHPPSDDFRASMATTDAAQAEQVQAAIAEAPIHSQAPSVSKAFLDQQMKGQTVQVDADKLVELASQGHTPFPELGPQILQAAADGTPLEVPAAQYHAALAGQSYAGDLNATSVFREGGVSVEGAKEVPPVEVRRSAQPTVEPPSNFTPDETVRAKTMAMEAHQAVDEVVQAQGISELFKDPAAVGMTKPQFERYGAAIDNAIAEAKDKLTQQAYEQILRERKPEWKTAVQQHSAEVEQELAKVPVIQARAYLAQGKGPLGEPIETPFKLDKEDVIAKYGKDLGLPDRYFRKGGLSADEAADLLNFPSGADMMRQLAALHTAQGDMSIAEHMKALVKGEAETRTRAQLGFGITPDEVYNAASEAINSPKITEFLSDELKALAKQAGLPYDKAAVTRYADARFQQLTVKAARNLRQLEGYVYKGGIKAEKALLKSDLPTAFIRKQQQFIHHLMLKEAHKFAKEYSTAKKLLDRVTDKVTIKGTSQDALDWSKEALTQLGIDVKANPKDLAALHNGGKELRDYVNERNEEGAQIEHANVPRLPLAQQSVEDFRAFSNMITAMMHWGREENTVLVRGEKQDLREALDDGINSLNRYTRNITQAELTHPDLMEKMDAVRRGLDAWLVRMEQLMRDFGAKDPNSPFFQIITRRIQEAKAWENDNRLALAQHFGAVATDVGKGFDRWLRARVPDETSALVMNKDGSPVFMKNRDIFMAALHLGDEGALEAFAKGFNTDVDTVTKAVMDNATPQMWKAVRGILHPFAKHAPDVEAMYKRITGVTPELVPAREFKMADGSTNPGGYFPIRYNWAKMPKEMVKQVEAEEKMLGSPRYEKVRPSNNYIKSRKGPAGPVDMDFGSVYSRINQMIHDLAYREALIDAQKFLLHPDMKEAISLKYGPEYVDKLRADLRDIAGSMTRGKVEEMAGRALDYLSEAQMVNMIGYSPKTMIKHGLTAQFQSMREVGVGRYLASMKRLTLHFSELKNQAEESADIRHILSAYSEDAYQQYLRLVEAGKGGVLTTMERNVRSFAFHMVGGSNYITAVPLYDAAKTMLGEKYPGMSEADVRAAAGQLVRQSLGSTGPADSPIALRMGADKSGLTGKFFRLTNPFLSFLSHMYNKSREIPQALGYAGEKVDIGAGLATLITAVIIPIYVEQSVTRGEIGFGKKAGDKAEYWLSGLIHNEAGGVPILNTAVAALMKKLDPRYPGGDDSITSIFGSWGQSIKDLNDHFVKHHPWTEARTEHATIATGYAARGVPGVALVRLENFIHELHHTPQHALHDLIFGKGHKK